MDIFNEPKVDCHAHIFDPARFPYQEDNRAHPTGGEIGTVEQLCHVMAAYGVRHAVLVQPNSGYGSDNSYLLQAVSEHKNRFRGMARVSNDIDFDDLLSLKKRGISGAALNPTFDGLDYYRDAGELIAKLGELDMFVNIQVQNNDLLSFMPWLLRYPVKVLIDHCGRPAAGARLERPAFRALLQLASTGRASIKISGFAKFSAQRFPFEDTYTNVRAVIDAFTPAHCLWASDWPFLRSPQRQDYGPLVNLAAIFFPDPAERKAVLWDNPCRLFGFETKTRE